MHILDTHVTHSNEIRHLMLIVSANVKVHIVLFRRFDFED